MPFKKDFLNLLQDFKAAITPTEDAPSGQRTDLVLTGHFRKMMRKGVFETAAFAQMDLSEMDKEMEMITPLDKDDVSENNLLHEAAALGRPQTLRILIHIARTRDEAYDALFAQNVDGKTPLEYGAKALEILEGEARELDVNLQLNKSENPEEDKAKLETILTHIVHAKDCQEILSDAMTHAKARQVLKNNNRNNNNNSQNRR